MAPGVLVLLLIPLAFMLNGVVEVWRKHHPQFFITDYFAAVFGFAPGMKLLSLIPRESAGDCILIGYMFIFIALSMALGKAWAPLTGDHSRARSFAFVFFSGLCGHAVEFFILGMLDMMNFISLK